MNDHQIVALMAAILIGQTGPGQLINEKEAVEDAMGIWLEARTRCRKEFA